jgi:hypothetical protein
MSLNEHTKHIITKFEKVNTVDKKLSDNVFSFTSVISPLNSIKPSFSHANGSVEFRMRRRNKTVTLQWEPFTALISVGGSKSFYVSQSISNLPPYIMDFPITLRYKNKVTNGYVTIDPFVRDNRNNISFNLDLETNTGDIMNFNGGSISWICD